MPGLRATIRRRDRRGRGLRGPLSPSHVPLSVSRAERFDDLVLESVERLEPRWGRQLRGVEFAVEDVPPARQVGDEATSGPLDGFTVVPLGRCLPRAGGLPARIVVYRWPLEARARGRMREMAALVHDVVVEHVAELLGLPAHEVDPGYLPPEDDF